jgi:L-ascorbate metabolism protein UlaG (beta-lactamase superfamily)
MAQLGIRFRRPIKWLLTLAGLLTGCVASAFFIMGYTSFGKVPSGERLNRMKQSPQWHGDKFENPQPIWSDMKSAVMQSFRASPDATPKQPIPVIINVKAELQQPLTSQLRVTWLGHSTSLIEVDGTRILIDPVWSERTSPVSWLGPKRWYKPLIKLADLPHIDAVLISHDHYDHLDRATIEAMKDWDTQFLVPLGIGAHLEYWGVPASKITELDWWDSAHINDVEIVATPARHASGRLIPQSNKTLWSGFAMIGPAHRVYYSGDTGYFPGFKDIGSWLGPFDVTLIETGQYNAFWPDWHLGPEQAVKAHQEVRGAVMIPVHWGLFELAPHSWTEPAERVLAAAKVAGVVVNMPKPGQSIEPTHHASAEKWWPHTEWQMASMSPIIATKNGNPTERFGDAVWVTHTH